jgi:hypothetical protein
MSNGLACLLPRKELLQALSATACLPCLPSRRRSESEPYTSRPNAGNSPWPLLGCLSGLSKNKGLGLALLLLLVRL